MARSPVEHRIPLADGRVRAPEGATTVVVGGGIAGLAAATVLAERGVHVTVVEREAFLGGRAGAWSDALADGEPFEMERGFHAFFRQYYNLRALLRRIDPELRFLVPVGDYPIHGPDGEVQSFSNVPTSTPANLISMTLRSPDIGLRELSRIDRGRAMEMLTYHPERTYVRRDRMSAGAYLDSLDFPPRARRLFFDVFAHSFFNPEREMSAAELIMMFHFYFTGNPEGLVFDVASEPFSTAIWDPMRAYLEGLGVAFRMGEAVGRVERGDAGWRVVTGGGGAGRGSGAYEATAVVLALPVAPLESVVGASPALGDPVWRARIDGLALTNPFAVWRIWLDRPTRAGRAPFVGTTGMGPIDNISLYHLFEGESRRWAEKHGGSVVELHAYAIDPDADEDRLKTDLLRALHDLYPETSDAGHVDERWLVRRDCPAFAPGSHHARPTVDTPFDSVALAGDFVKLPIPSALMERAAASGFLAANEILAGYGVRSEPVLSVPAHGMLAGLPMMDR